MPESMFITHLPLESVIESFLECLWTLSLKRKVRNTTFPMELSVLVCLLLVSSLRKSDQKSSINGYLPSRLQKLLLLSYSSLESLSSLSSSPTNQHHSQRPQYGKNRAFCSQMIKKTVYSDFKSSF